MKILVTNDDGINCPNLKTLVEHLKKYYEEILVVAPNEEYSCVSHKINISRPIKLTKCSDLVENVKTYTIDSTPADCVKFALKCLQYDFDILFSGINDGLNLGEDIAYSGTVAAATEALFSGKKAVACSTERGNVQGFIDSFDIFMKDYLNNEIYKDYVCFNVNFPINPKGIKYAYQGWNDYKYWFEPLGNNLYMPKAIKQFKEQINIYDTDLDCYHNGYITVTPITQDMTNYIVLNKIKNK